MSSHDSRRNSMGHPSLLPLNIGSRRGSLASLTGQAAVDKEQLSQALDKIHSTACQSDKLTTFNEFAPPPPSTSESQGLAGEIMQNGLSGLYSRFKDAVGVGKEKNALVLNKGDGDSIETGSVKSMDTPTSKRTVAASREDSGVTVSPAQVSTTSSSRLQSPTTSSFAALSSESQSPAMKSSMTSMTSNPSSRPSLTPMAKATVSAAMAPAVAPANVNAFKDGDKDRTTKTEVDKSSKEVESIPFGPRETIQPVVDSDSDEPSNNGTNLQTPNSVGVDGNHDSRKGALVNNKSASMALSSLQASDSNHLGLPSRVSNIEGLRRLAAIESITQSHLPGYQASRASSTDRSTAEATPIHTSAHNSVRHENFAADVGTSAGYPGRSRIPGTTVNEGAPEAVSTRLEQMRKQVMSKEFWMGDDKCKECFLCNDTFSVIRRKHHCRTCGCIFDSKCTSIISGQRFGVQGTLRVCKTCLDIINNRHDSSASDDSDDASLPTFFQAQQAKFDSTSKSEAVEPPSQSQELDKPIEDDRSRALATPMMAIPATRRVGDSANRQSLVLDIDGPQLSRPSSARSLKSMSAGGRPASSGHKRHQSKHNFLGRFKSTAQERAPFQGGVGDDAAKRSRLPAFHDDNIIDPDLAPYMSDEESSADEQPSIFATMNKDVLSPSFENDRSGFGSLLSAGKRHRARTGEKSVSGFSLTGRGMDEVSGGASVGGFTRQSRRRNLSAASHNLYQSRTSPRPIIPGFGNLNEEAAVSEVSSTPTTLGPSRMTRSASMKDNKSPDVELNTASLHHVRKLLHQLLEDANIPTVASWEKALIPILLKCTDDVDPNVRHGDDIDIRHYVKLKRIPGGRPGDTAYVSGVVFTKNLALKSMSRSIANPRIVIVSFPIEYQRHQHHFMSLEPVIAQEKEFLKNMVNRIASLRPQLLLVQKHISGLALQYLAEANIAVAYNVKQSVIEAVARMAQTEIISSIDMVALKPVHVGKCAGFDVKTYVHKDIPGKKKTCIYLSGCQKELGCTIALRGANMDVLSKMKRITEFMVYVVYNLKLETCLMRDEYVLIPSIAENSGSMSPSKHHASQPVSNPGDVVAAASDTLHAVAAAGEHFRQLNKPEESGQAAFEQELKDPSSTDAPIHDTGISDQKTENESAPIPKRLISVHESHAHGHHEDQVPEDIPMPTFYSDMVAKHQTKILSASPFVKFMQPYLLMRARELERRLVYLKRMRDQDTFEEQPEEEKIKPEKFQLIKPEMVHDTDQRAPRQIMEVLHAVHDAEYDKAMHNYQTQKRQWENHVSMNSHLFDPYAHQNITVLYTVVCTKTSIPCAGPELLALAFYNEHDVSRDFDADCTLGQYVEDLCSSVNTICTSNGCEKKMSEHHRTYVHGEAGITVFIEKSPCKLKGLQESILMWNYCKKCNKESRAMPMSDSTWKYSLGKYLELSFWSSGLRPRTWPDGTDCPHDLQSDHFRYFGFRNVAIRIRYDPIDLLEIIVPRARITWKVDKDLKLKNELFTKFEERWNRYMVSVKSRIKGINIDSVAPEKAEACKAEVERLTKLAQEEHVSMIRKLQEKYMESKYYEIVPLNRALRAMQEKVAEWDDAFAEFDSNFFPSEKDIRRLAALQLKKMFMDRDESTSSLASTEGAEVASDIDAIEERSPSTSLELTRNPSQLSAKEAQDVLTSVVEDHCVTSTDATKTSEKAVDAQAEQLDQQGIEHLDLAIPHSNDPVQTPVETPMPSEPSSSQTPLSSEEALASLATDHQEETTLSQKIEKLRMENQSHLSDQTGNQVEPSGIPRPSERGGSRKNGLATSPPLNRTQSQPAGTVRRAKPLTTKPFSKQADTKHVDDTLPSIEPLKPSATEPAKPTDKKLSERLGLSTLKSRKGGHSLIPRSVTGKRKESKVSTLAKHFEQLSREFEKERLKDRRQRAAKATQSRAFPKASSKPIVEVYRDVDEAVEERGPADGVAHDDQPSHSSTEAAPIAKGLAGLTSKSSSGEIEPHSPTDAIATADETATEAETDHDQHNISHTGSDDDAGASDADHSLLDDIIPDTASLAESLRKPEADMPLEIPKHEKSSLMKMLTNFWAERSASGWTPLDYPISVSDHIFADIDVIIREDEPSSLIAFALQSQSYRDKLVGLRGCDPDLKQGDGKGAGMPDGHYDICSDGVDQAEVETSLLRSKGTHISLSFADGSATMQCKIFYAEQFDAVRRKCGVADRIVESLSRCLKWDSKGGKTKSVFLKTLDDRLILKSLSSIETQAFLKFAPAYFNIMAEVLFHELPSVIAKMLGFYQIFIKNPTTGTEIKLDVLVMENLFYDRSPTRIFDLKGSMRNRKIQSTGEQNEVLLDENMVEFIYESPLFTREHSKKLLRAGIFNDTLFLQRNDVMDYSLMVAVDESRKELVVGIIDVVRTYTWDKKLEYWIKDRGFAGGGRNRPTITSPKEYKSRFREAMNRYILQAPNSWHQWQQLEPQKGSKGSQAEKNEGSELD